MNRSGDDPKPGAGPRFFADLLGLVAHVVLVCVAATSTVIETVPVLLLTVMSGITAAFHIVYVLAAYNHESWKVGWFQCGNNERNTLKWLEYGITATIASIAIAFSGDSPPHWSIVFFIAAVAVTEQTTGFTWDSIKNTDLAANLGGDGASMEPLLGGRGDEGREMAAGLRAFYTTFLCQIAEFCVLYELGGKNLVAFIFYVVGWTSFGVWAWLRDPTYTGAIRRVTGVDITIGRNNSRIEAYETGYSLLSTFAKVSVFAATLAYELGR